MNAPRRRPGFTLLELIVVMGIIALVAGLTIAAVMRVWVVGPRFETQIEIRRLDNALREFAREHNDTLPPPQVRLCELRSDYAMSELDIKSLDILQSMFGADMWGPNGKALVDWDGDGVPSPPVVLTGDQCLVFFLGGVPLQPGPGVRGFAATGNPAARPGKTYFNFHANRLVKVRGNNFYSYLDPYKKVPYAYFSQSKLGYNYWTTLAPSTCAFDCPNLSGVDVSPYKTAPGTFHMPDSFQIISAGRDGVFGPGGNVLTERTGATLPLPAHDDLTNFSGVQLGGY